MADLLPNPIISTPSVEDILFLVLNLRQTDSEETFGTLPLLDGSEVEHLVDQIFASSRAALFCEMYSSPSDGKPFAIAFINRATQTSAYFNFICTDGVYRHFRWLTAEVQSRLPGVMEANGLDRVECRARAIQSHIRWLEMIGARLECAVPGFSRHSFAQLAWVRGSDHVLFQ